MRQRLLVSIGAAAVGAVVVVMMVPVAGQAPATAPKAAPPKTAPVLKTSWGEPDLQGIWDTTPVQIPLQRAARYAGKEFFTDEEIAELDRVKAKLPGKETRATRGTERMSPAPTTPSSTASGTRAVERRSSWIRRTGAFLR